MSEIRNNQELMAFEEQLRQKALGMPMQQSAPMPMQQGMLPAAAGQMLPGTQPELLPAQAQPKMRGRMTEDRIRRAWATLTEYKRGKTEMDKRLMDNERWWDARAWPIMQNQGNIYTAKRPTMWLFNVVLGKHADMVEAYPEPAILPREQMDEITARILSAIVPVVLEQNDFDEIYNMQAWEKNKNGTAIYAITWDKEKLNGLGDIRVSAVDPLNIYWQPGIDDIQHSRNVFVIQWADKEALVGQYPWLEGKNLDSGFTRQKYETEDSGTRDEMKNALVVDWYYHTWEQGKKQLHYCKFVGENVLYSTEEMGAPLYEDGLYPFVVDVLFPIKGSIAGRGYIDIGKETQEVIDNLDHAMVLNAMAGAIPRYISAHDTTVNEAEFLDFTKPVVHTQGGNLNETNWQRIEPTQLSPAHLTMLQNKIEELKQVTGNQDVSNGSSGGVVAASAIAALQESAGRSSRSGIKGTWRAYANLVQMVISRMRQFYDVKRTFRITGENMAMEYASISKMQLAAQPMDFGGFMGMRIPEFDIQVSAQKQNAYSKMAQNELALQLLNAGVFNPQLSDQSLMLLSMMDFPKKDELVQKVRKNGTLLQQMAMWQQMALQLAQKYEPQMAEAMAGNIMQGAGLPMQTAPVNPDMDHTPEESRVTEKARERSANASQPAA